MNKITERDYPAILMGVIFTILQQSKLTTDQQIEVFKELTQKEIKRHQLMPRTRLHEQSTGAIDGMNTLVNMTKID